MPLSDIPFLTSFSSVKGSNLSEYEPAPGHACDLSRVSLSCVSMLKAILFTSSSIPGVNNLPVRPWQRQRSSHPRCFPRSAAAKAATTTGGGGTGGSGGSRSQVDEEVTPDSPTFCPCFPYLQAHALFWCRGSRTGLGRAGLHMSADAGRHFRHIGSTRGIQGYGEQYMEHKQGQSSPSGRSSSHSTISLTRPRQPTSHPSRLGKCFKRSYVRSAWGLSTGCQGRPG